MHNRKELTEMVLEIRKVFSESVAKQIDSYYLQKEKREADSLAAAKEILKQCFSAAERGEMDMCFSTMDIEIVELLKQAGAIVTRVNENKLEGKWEGVSVSWG